MDMSNLDAFQGQQALAYQQGRNAFTVARTATSNPYTTGSFKAEAWDNGFRDEKEGR